MPKLKIFCLMLSLHFLAGAASFAQEPGFLVSKVAGKTATLEGETKGLQAGDLLYATHSPFRFTVTAVKGKQVTITLPEKHELSPGNTLLRSPSEAIKKALQTESRLKQALEE